jgi:protein-tyrosine phosphatase
MAAVDEVTVIVACTECGVFWPRDAGPPQCVDPAHSHSEHELHRHRTPVDLGEGVEVVAVSFDAADPYTRDRAPDFGLYLDSRWQPPWPHDHVDWPDFGVPADAETVVAALRDLLRRARSGERVEIGCQGGHGRTGTALACLAVLTGRRRGEAVAWVRANYCEMAVETDDQAAFVAGLTPGGP